MAGGDPDGAGIRSPRVEDSVYAHPRAAGRGIGNALQVAFIDSTEAAGI